MLCSFLISPPLEMLLIAAQALATSLMCWRFWVFYKSRSANSLLNNIPGPPARSIWSGSFADFYNVDGWAYHDSIAKTYGGVIKIKALIGENQLFIFDPKALQYILVKEQHIYEESPSVIMAHRLIFGEGLLGTLADQHRKQRKMLNPVFSVAHLREMLPTFYEVSYKLRDAIEHEIRNGPQIEIMSWVTRTALEIIGQSGLGYSFDSLIDNTPQHPYSEAAKQLVPSMFKLNMLSAYVLLPLSQVGTPEFRRWIVDAVPYNNLHAVRDIVDVIYDTSVKIFEAKKAALDNGDETSSKQVGRGKDIMSILIRANMTASKEDSLTQDELLGQMSTLIFAAMDTTSTALSRTLHLLSHNQDIQDKLRKEITEAREGGGDLSYDDLVSLPYLDAICRETLRLHPPVPLVNRTTRADTVLPLATPIRGVDGREMREIAIPKGTLVNVGILASNRNHDIWGPDADEWKPERWLTPLPDSVAAAHLPGIYSNLLTFLGGGRSCIGFKFAQLEMKVVLLILIQSFRFHPTEDKILWQMTGVATPVVVDSSKETPQLPLLVEKVL